jgi:Mg/Co/Ni transporter MgtE
MKDYELAKISLEELLLPAFERMAKEEPEKLARMLPPEQLAKALPPEQLAKAFTPEQLAKAFTPEQLTKILEALPPEVREQIKQRLH